MARWAMSASLPAACSICSAKLRTPGVGRKPSIESGAASMYRSTAALCTPTTSMRDCLEIWAEAGGAKRAGTSRAAARRNGRMEHSWMAGEDSGDVRGNWRRIGDMASAGTPAPGRRVHSPDGRLRPDRRPLRPRRTLSRPARRGLLRRCGPGGRVAGPGNRLRHRPGADSHRARRRRHRRARLLTRHAGGLPALPRGAAGRGALARPAGRGRHAVVRSRQAVHARHGAVPAVPAPGHDRGAARLPRHDPPASRPGRQADPRPLQPVPRGAHAAGGGALPAPDAEFTSPDGRQVTRRYRITARDLAAQVNHVEMLYEITYPDGREERLVHAFSMRWLYRFEAEHLLARAGYRVEQVYSGYDRSPFGSSYPGELILVAGRT